MEAEFRLRQFVRNDFPILINGVESEEILNQCSGMEYHWPLNNAQLEGLLALDQCEHFMLEQNGLPCAYGDIRYNEVNTARLCRLLVFHGFRGMGIGKELVTSMIRHIHRNHPGMDITLNVLEGNMPAQNCYLSCGFRHTAEYKELEIGGILRKIIKMEIRHESNPHP